MSTRLILSVFFATIGDSILLAQQWNALSSGLNGPVHVIVPLGNDVFVGGDFTDAGGDPDADYLARWDGYQWHSIVPGLNGIVRAIAVDEEHLIVGGQFTTPHKYGIYRDGGKWHALAPEVNGPVAILEIGQDGLYAAGDFDGKVARWTEGTWNILGAGLSGQVNAIAIRGQDVFIGGQFYIGDGDPVVQQIIRWDGSEWQHMDQPSDIINILDLAIYDADLYLCGHPVTNCQGGQGGIHEPIMRWDGNTYSKFDPRLGGCRTATTLLVLDDRLYIDVHDVLGEIAVFEWDLVSGAINGFLPFPFHYAVPPVDRILSLATDGSNIYMGGIFTDIYGANGDHIVRWGEQSTGSRDIVGGLYSEVNIFPNPAQDEIYYTVEDDDLRQYTISITGSDGSSYVFDCNANNTVDISMLPPGVFLLKAEGDGKFGLARFIKQ